MKPTSEILERMYKNSGEHPAYRKDFRTVWRNMMQAGRMPGIALHPQRSIRIPDGTGRGGRGSDSDACEKPEGILQ